MANQYGNNLKLQIYGGSHDREIGARLRGFPCGFRPDMAALARFMARRTPGNDPTSTARREADIPHFLSGLDKNGVTDGSVLHAAIYNSDQHSSDYAFIYDTPRPSHADFAALQKYGKSVDLRGGGRFSGRLTAPLCAVGGICLQYLATKGIYIGAHIERIGNVCDLRFDPVSLTREALELPEKAPFPTLDSAAGEAMRQRILAAKAELDSVGGVVECAVIGLPAGLGEHMFDGVEGRLASILYAVPAVKGVEFGNGFAAAALCGSENNDPFVTDGKTVRTLTNNCGGVLGGMTNGMPLILRAAFKPTPSIGREQQTVSLSRMENTTLAIKGRHDPSVVVRAVPVVIAATAIAVCDLLLDPEPPKDGNVGLAPLRAQIDAIDRELVQLFCRRMETVDAIAAVKKEAALPVLDAAREAALLDRVAALAGASRETDVRALYTLLLSLSRKAQEAKLGEQKEREI